MRPRLATLAPVVALIAGLGACAPCSLRRGQTCVEHRAGLFDELRHGELQATRSAGCLELAFRGRGDLLELFIGNACEYPVPLDVSKMRVWGRGPDGDVALRLNDPRKELRRLHVDTLRLGVETLRLVRAKRDDARAVEAVCVDVSAVAVEDLFAPHEATACWPQVVR